MIFCGLRLSQHHADADANQHGYTLPKRYGSNVHAFKLRA